MRTPALQLYYSGRDGDAEADHSRGAFHYEDSPELNPFVRCEIQQTFKGSRGTKTFRPCSHAGIIILRNL